MSKLFKFCSSTYFTGLVILVILASVGTELTMNTPIVIWTIGNGVGMIAGALISNQ